jgi:LmbE family N-acetylglucosaminyl deacetylase
VSARPLPVNELPEDGGVTTDLEVPERALAVGAHPDDIDFGCGATLAKWAAAGAGVHYAVLTDGARGSWDPQTTPEGLRSRRQREQQAAAQRLGAEGVNFFDERDGELVNDAQLRWRLCRLIRRLRPDVVLGHDPWRRYRLHPDHRAAGFLLTDSLVAARDPLFFPDQGVAAHRPRALLLWEADVANHVETATGYELAKVEALLAHHSQYRTTMGIEGVAEPVTGDHAAVSGFRHRVLDQLRRQGALAGSAAGEAFHIIEEI